MLFCGLSLTAHAHYMFKQAMNIKSLHYHEYQNIDLMFIKME
jgi:hypothetical protein